LSAGRSADKQNHDRADAKKLATLVVLDQVPPMHVPSVDVRGWRSLIEHRRPEDVSGR
jgi:hypothetical protein